MRTGYLQRLVDRVATARPPVSPGGGSRSPVAAADQRLNEPGLADLFSFTAALADDDGQSEAPHDRDRRLAPWRSPTREPETPAAPDEPTSPTAPTRDASPGDVRANAAPVALRSVEPAAALRPVGHVAPGDLVPAETQSDTPVDALEGDVRAPYPDDPRPRLVAPAPAIAPPAPGDASSDTTSAPPRERAPAATRDPVLMGTSVAAEGREQPQRTITAAVASLIGPLTPAPRARTMFGLRRR